VEVLLLMETMRVAVVVVAYSQIPIWRLHLDLLSQSQLVLVALGQVQLLVMVQTVRIQLLVPL
jgi:hypothetical protein